jgi:hypothetical protein
MPSKKLALPSIEIDNVIREIRGVRVILDSDLARIYGVPTKRLNEQFRRNRSRFPDDFAFQLTAEEVTNLRTQIATLKKGAQNDALNWSQFATSSSKHRGKVYRPWAFTEHGALQAANILNSARADEYDVRGRRWMDHRVRLGSGRAIGRSRVNVFVIRAFVKMRETLLGTRELARKLAALEKKLTGRLDSHEAAIVHVLQELMLILNPPPPAPGPPKPRIGFTP